MLQEPDLLGGLPAFRDLTSWRAWLAFLRAFYGLPMEAGDLELFRLHTGRTMPRAGGYPEAVCITGCQSGKSQIAAAVGAYEALQASARGSRGVYVPLVAQDLRGATRTLLEYVREIFSIPALKLEIVRDVNDALALRFVDGDGRTVEGVESVIVGTYPCRPGAIRGIRIPTGVVDEIAHFVTTDGRPTDVEMLRAVRTRLAMAPGGGRLLILSSPYGQAGALFDLHRRHFGRDDSPTLVWQATAPAMNPMLPADYVDRMRLEDPEAYRSEVLGEFRTGLTTLLDPEALDACVATGRRELERLDQVAYRAFVDPSGGRADAFTVAIAHRAQRIVVDVVRAWAAPFNPSSVVAEAAELLKAYGVFEVTGDRYGGEWPREAFRAHGIEYAVAEHDRSALYLALLPVVNSAGVELLDLVDLLRELRGLERRRGSAGRDRVDHRPGSHDDQANAVAGVVSLLSVVQPIEGALFSVEKTAEERHRYGGFDPVDDEDNDSDGPMREDLRFATRRRHRIGW